MATSLLQLLHLNDAYSFGLLAGAALVAGLVRGFSGFGYAMVFVPLAALIVGPVMAVALIWFIDLPFALPLALKGKENADVSEVYPLVIGSTLLFPLGIWLLLSLDPTSVRWIISSLVLVAVVALAIGWRYRGVPSRQLSFSVGGLSGITGGLANMGGMPLAIFWLAAQKNDAQRTKNNLNLFFGIEAVISGVMLWWSGVLTWAGFNLALALCIPFGIGLIIGLKGFHLATEETFRRVAYTIIALSAVLAMPLLDGWIK